MTDEWLMLVSGLLCGFGIATLIFNPRRNT